MTMGGASDTAQAYDPWSDALLGAALLAVDPAGLKGVRLRAAPGPVRDAWIDAFAKMLPEGAPWRRFVPGTPEARLLGGLDLPATLAAGRPVEEPGLLAASDGGVLVAAMAERLPPAVAASIGAALDEGLVRTERDGVSARHPARFALIALDEGIGDDEALPPVLRDRLALTLALDAVPLRALGSSPWNREAIAAARQRVAGVAVPDAAVEALAALALAAGVASLRLPVLLVRAARAAAALRKAEAVGPQDCAAALRLALGISSTAEEAPPEQAAPEPSPPDEGDTEGESSGETRELAEALIQTIAARLPPGLLDEARRERTKARGASAGKAGAARVGARGRRVGTADRPPRPGARLDVLATLRAAAPWQRLRIRRPDAPLAVRKSDFRYPRRRERTGTTAVCVIDASGSAAVERLAEAKGAVELLLAQAYVRRDAVALIAFRGTGAEVLLEPTRSLTRAKRAAVALPGGGGTPLAAALRLAFSVTLAVRTKGQTTLTVFLTDGRGNIALDGSASRPKAEADAAAHARLFREKGLPAVVIDTAQRPRGQAETLARELGGRYLALPRAGSRGIADAILSSTSDALPVP